MIDLQIRALLIQYWRTLNADVYGEPSGVSRWYQLTWWSCCAHLNQFLTEEQPLPPPRSCVYSPWGVSPSHIWGVSPSPTRSSPSPRGAAPANTKLRASFASFCARPPGALSHVGVSCLPPVSWLTSPAPPPPVHSESLIRGLNSSAAGCWNKSRFCRDLDPQ